MVDKKMIAMNDAVQRKDGYIVLWRNGQKDAARVLSCDTSNEAFTFELVSGPDKGKTKTANYDPLQQVAVYDEESVIVAVLET